MEEITEERPVIIVGAGLAGLAAAISLRRLGLAVVVVDKVQLLKPIPISSHFTHFCYLSSYWIVSFLDSYHF